MICFRRKTYLATGLCLVAFASMLRLSYKYLQKYSHLPKLILQRDRGLCRGRMASNSISVLRDNRTLVIASYFDNRVENLTRVIGIVPREEVKEYYCWFCCQAADRVYMSKAVINVHADHFGFPYATADLICIEPIICEPRSLLLNSVPYGDGSQLLQFEIKNRKLESSSVEFTVCISSMFGDYNNILQFVQSMEMYKLLGAQRVVIYKNSCSRLMEKVLEFYVAQGTVEIVPWPITSYLRASTAWHWDPKDKGKQIGYYGQIAALNDCVYRNMYRSRYVLLNDADEIILPAEHADWRALMESLEKQNPKVGIFFFENHIFPNTVFTSDNIPYWNAVPGVNILQHNLREPDRKEVFNPKKMIVNPRKVVQTSVHLVLQAMGDSIDVPMEVAMVHHCRAPLQPDIPREFLIRDTTLWRYNSSLINSVSHVLRNIPLKVVK